MRRTLSPGQLGLRFFLLSLTMLFAASLVGILVVRYKAAVWPPAGAPTLPKGLWASTALIFLSSWTMGRAVRHQARGESRPTTRFLLATAGLALAFIANQTHNWLAIWPGVRVQTTALYVFSFLLLTVLHALHVLGGLVSLAVVTAKAGKGRLSAAGLSYAATYWHFLTGVWLVLFLFLELAF